MAIAKKPDMFLAADFALDIPLATLRSAHAFEHPQLSVKPPGLSGLAGALGARWPAAPGQAGRFTNN